MRRLSLASFVLVLSLSACSSSDPGAEAGAAAAGVGGAAGAMGGGAAGGGATGGAGGGEAAGGAASGGLPCEVNALLVARCQQCHSNPPVFGAPMPLVTRADLLAPAPTDATTTVGARSVVRVHDDVKPMPQPPNPRASEAEVAALEAWVSAGMPASSEGCNGAGGAGGAGAAGSAGASGAAGGGGTSGVTCKPDQLVKATAPWTIKQDTADQYVCFGGKIPASSKKRHITEVYVDIDNKAHAHHLCIYDMGKSAVSTTPQPCMAGSAITLGKLLYCWAPGADAATLPPEAGFPLDAGVDTNILIEMHYSNIQGAPDSTDNSAATFCTTEELRPNDADVMAFGSGNFSLPPMKATTVENNFTVKAGQLKSGQIRIIRGWPHMHLLGVAQSTVVTRDGQVVGDLGSTDKYSFDNQISYPVDVTIKANDTITTKCMYNNFRKETVSFGDNTEAEMCYNFVTYYPRIESPTWVWALLTFLGETTTYPTP
jgi:hypothetical protein